MNVSQILRMPNFTVDSIPDSDISFKFYLHSVLRIYRIIEQCILKRQVPVAELNRFERMQISTQQQHEDIEVRHN